jgi:hypothetical protein
LFVRLVRDAEVVPQFKPLDLFPRHIPLIQSIIHKFPRTSIENVIHVMENIPNVPIWMIFCNPTDKAEESTPDARGSSVAEDCCSIDMAKTVNGGHLLKLP